MRNDDFRSVPDEELARTLQAGLSGPDPEAYLGRLRGFLAELPERDTEWDVLARWARPGVLAAAMAAAFLLGATLFMSWPRQTMPEGTPSVSMPAAAMLIPAGEGPAPITFAVLEGR